jgi:hypothetical protein
MGKKGEQSSRREWIWVIALLCVLLFLAMATGWRIHFQGLEVQALETRLENAVAKNRRASGRKRQALLGATALAELQGWKEASPFTSGFVAGLANLSDGLLLRDCLLERQFSIKPLSGEAPGRGLPLPVRAIHLSDSALLTVCETQMGSGVRPLPELLSKIGKETGCSVEYERCSRDVRWDEPGTDRVEGESAWNLSVELPPRPLWADIWGRP